MMEIALIRGVLLLGLLLAAVSGCRGDFKDLQDFPLLNVGYAVTSVINMRAPRGGAHLPIAHALSTLSHSVSHSVTKALICSNGQTMTLKP